MPINECCNIGVVCCDAETSITNVAALMRKHHVGDVIVVEEKDAKRVPVGIVTDRDIVIETIAVDADADAFTAGDLMSAPIVTVNEEAGLVEALRMMRNHKIRRMPVVTEDGALSGIVTADDIIKLLSFELSMMTDTLAEQQIKEARAHR